jgi:pilus assembly protein Flp/PilA
MESNTLRRTESGDNEARSRAMSAISIYRSFLRNESGTTSIEYALIAGIISIVIVASLTQIRGNLQGTFTDVSDGISDALS